MPTSSLFSRKWLRDQLGLARRGAGWQIQLHETLDRLEIAAVQTQDGPIGGDRLPGVAWRSGTSLELCIGVLEQDFDIVAVDGHIPAVLSGRLVVVLPGIGGISQRQRLDGSCGLLPLMQCICRHGEDGDRHHQNRRQFPVEVSRCHD